MATAAIEPTTGPAIQVFLELLDAGGDAFGSGGPVDEAVTRGGVVDSGEVEVVIVEAFMADISGGKRG